MDLQCSYACLNATELEGNLKKARGQLKDAQAEAERATAKLKQAEAQWAQDRDVLHDKAAHYEQQAQLASSQLEEVQRVMEEEIRGLRQRVAR